jgi:hypothetical protein
MRLRIAIFRFRSNLCEYGARIARRKNNREDRLTVRQIVLLLVIVLLGPAAARSAEVSTFSFYVQLVRGSDADTPPSPDAVRVGVEVGRRLHGVFRWKNYWEMKRQHVLLSEGKTVRAQMSPHLDVEISVPGNQEMVVCIYADGKLIRQRHQAVQTRFYITGGDNDDAQSWFIVVRRDEPGAAETVQAGM